MDIVIAAYLGVEADSIVSINLKVTHDLSIGSESDYGRSYDTVSGDVYEPRYEVELKPNSGLVHPENRDGQVLPVINTWVTLDDLFLFLFNQIQKK